MSFRLRYHSLADLPRLAWVATADPVSGQVDVVHGSAVECRDTWLVEGVWDGEFAEGGGAFHRSDHFFGSGLVVEGDRLYVVASTGLGDRVLWTEHRGRVLASNSLPLLLATTGAHLDHEHDYRIEAFAIRQGAQRGPDGFVVDHPEIRTFRQLYDGCVALDPSGTAARVSLRRAPRFGSYGEYRTLLDHALRRLHANASSAARRFQLPTFVTISSGYDSVATAALVAGLGVTAAFTCRRSNSHLPGWIAPGAAIDDGTPIARALGLPLLSPRASGVAVADERYFVAAGCVPPTFALEPLLSHVARECTAAVIFTGFGGDHVWDTQGEREYHEQGFVRGDPAALGLSEARLQSGCINVSVPTIGSRHIQDLTAVGRAPEMDPWRLLTAYDRPIPRRIAETAGVPRHCFGHTKKAVVTVAHYPGNPRWRASFYAFVRRTLGVRPMFVRLHDGVNRLAFPFARVWQMIRRVVAGGDRVWAPKTPPAFMWRRYDFAYAMFLWAAEALSAELAALPLPPVVRAPAEYTPAAVAPC